MLKRISTFALTGLVVLGGALQASAQQAPQPPSLPPSQWYWHGPWHGSQFWWICPLMVLFMVVFFGAIYLVVRRSWSGDRHHWGPPWHMTDRQWGPPTDSAIRILNERFARGEIEREEYEGRKAAILGGGPQ
jgi:uncharacterized membrane protein